MVVVTGASGFLGRAIVAELAARGIKTTAVSRRLTAVPNGVETVQVRDYSDTPQSDILIHLAESSEIALAEEQGDRHVASTSALLETLLSGAFAYVIYASSAAVYGDRLTHPRRPDELLTPTSVYARAKLACEERVLAAGGLVLRMANLYGPGMSDTNVISHVLNQIPGDGPLKVRDRGPIRDYLWIGDAVRGVLDCHNSACRGTYNLGSGQGTSVGELAELALGIAGQSDRPVVATSPSNRLSAVYLDISATTAACGWVPEVSLASGLQRLTASAS